MYVKVLTCPAGLLRGYSVLLTGVASSRCSQICTIDVKLTLFIKNTINVNRSIVASIMLQLPEFTQCWVRISKQDLSKFISVSFF